jgi:hypothetical protein
VVKTTTSGGLVQHMAYAIDWVRGERGKHPFSGIDSLGTLACSDMSLRLCIKW